MNTDLLLNNIKTITERFIKGNYADELQFFETFWHVFNSKLTALINSGNIEALSLKPASQIIDEISLVKENSLDLMTPVVMGVMAEIMFESRTGILPAEKLEKAIASSAARQGAKPSLTACLLRNIPALYKDLLQVDNGKNATVLENVTQYRIWTAGTERITESIEDFEKNKAKYLFWIDLDEKNNISQVNPKLKLSQQPAKLLLYLVKNIGRIKAVIYIYRDVFDPDLKLLEQTEIDNIETNLSKLHKFTGGKFRQYLVGNHREAIGLKDSFRDKYFLFERLGN